MFSTWEYAVLAAGACAVPYLVYDYRKRSQRKYFPGPPADPIIGHARSFPRTLPWEKFLEWGKQYGEQFQSLAMCLLNAPSPGKIMQLHAFGKTFIVLNDAQDAYNLMDRRGSKYSDRPRIVLVGEMLVLPFIICILVIESYLLCRVGFDGLLVQTRYGEDFRTLRRWTTQYFNSRDHISMLPLMSSQVKIFLNLLLDDPKNFAEHLDRSVALAVLLVPSPLKTFLAL